MHQLLLRATLIMAIVIAISENASAQRKAVFIILDGTSADVIEKLETPTLDEIATAGGYTRAYVGGDKGSYNESPTISSPGYNHVLTGTWSNKHNVWDNDIKDPNYHYWNIFRIVEHTDPLRHTAIFSSWLDNRTKLVGEELPRAGNIKLDYAFDGFEHDHEKFPHTEDRVFMFNIDEHVSKEAGRYIGEIGPDLSWVYLEFTDDMGHMYGDSPAYFDAIRKADAQVARIWDAVKQRQEQYGEEWMVIVTTDHGRDANTGHHHGGQSERERTVWITTNVKDVNDRFNQMPASVDIMPSILRFMEIEIPLPVRQEIDGVPFIGKISVANLRAKKVGNEVELSWQVLDPKGKAEVLIATSDNFRQGIQDTYTSLGKVRVRRGKFKFQPPSPSPFYKILLSAPENMTNVAIDKLTN